MELFIIPFLPILLKDLNKDKFTSNKDKLNTIIDTYTEELEESVVPVGKEAYTQYPKTDRRTFTSKHKTTRVSLRNY